jgi:hypothetical protein
MAKFYVVLAFLIVAAMFCLGAVVAHAGENPFKCTTKSEYDFRKSMPKGANIKVISGPAVIKMLMAINEVRINVNMGPWNAQRALVAYLSDFKVNISLFDRGCLVQGSDAEMNVNDAVTLLDGMGIGPTDLKSDIGV